MLAHSYLFIRIERPVYFPCVITKYWYPDLQQLKQDSISVFFLFYFLSTVKHVLMCSLNALLEGFLSPSGPISLRQSACQLQYRKSIWHRRFPNRQHVFLGVIIPQLLCWIPVQQRVVCGLLHCKDLNLVLRGWAVPSTSVYHTKWQPCCTLTLDLWWIA